MLATLTAPGFREFGPCQVRLFALIRKKARVGLFSALPDADLRRAHLTPVADLRAALDTELARLGRDTPVAIFPEGPRPIPSVASPA